MKRQHILNRAKAGIKGLIISWSDVDPLRESSDIIPGKVTHRNPVYRLTAGEIFTTAGKWILERQPFRWLVTIRVLFDYPNGQTQIEERELEAVATINALNPHCMDAIRDAMRHGNQKHYRHTEFTIECVGVG
jgi:hypothetical protein